MILQILTTSKTGAIEQAILSHPLIGEASVIGIPDPIKGHLPFAFVQPRQLANKKGNENIPATPPTQLFHEVNTIVRDQIGAIASLGGIIQGVGMIPKTRSGKTLRRVLRELVENAVIHGDYERKVNVPPTIEDIDVIEVARNRVKEYFEERVRVKSLEGKAKL